MKERIKFCPDLVGYEDIKAFSMMSTWESARVPRLHQCVKHDCVAYANGRCLKYNNSVFNKKEVKE